MLSPGDGIALAGVCSLVLAAIWKKSNGNRSECRTSDVCPDHSGVMANLDTIQSDIKEIKKDVKTLIGGVKT